MNQNDNTPAPVPTPRTEAKCSDYSGVLMFTGGEQFVPAAFARTLERELLSAQAALAQAKAELNDAIVRYNEAIESEHAITVEHLNRAQKAESDLDAANDACGKLLAERDYAEAELQHAKAALAEAQKRIRYLEETRAPLVAHAARAEP